MARFTVFLCLQLLFCYSCFAEDDNLVVQTANGLLKGKLATTRDMQVRQFLGIPYAQPPVRFTKPKPFGKWEGVREAVEFGPICVQSSLVEMFKVMNMSVNLENVESPQSEDCLSLNVYTPSKATPSDRFAVMVWIHGGGFQMGSGRSYNPSLLVALYNVVVVTINYRLGVFGFFNIPGTDVKGNYGMHDQVLSLHWVQQNIAAFGGNPDQVTIFGESAGSMSVSSLLLSPLSKGLFHRVIAQSGSSVSSYSCGKVLSTQGLDIFKKAIQCDGEHSKIMDCLRGKSADEVLAAQTNFSQTMMMIGPDYLTRPITDGEYLLDDAETLLRNSQVNKADVMLGFTANEGGFIALFCAGNVESFSVDTFKSCNQMVLPTMGASYSKLHEEAVVMEYLGGGIVNDSNEIHQRSMEVCTDVGFLAPTVLEGDLLVKAGNPVYMYVMDHEPHAPRYPAWLGAYHGSDLSYTFGFPLDRNAVGPDMNFFLPGNFSVLEEGFSKYVMQLWTNFAKYGNPNADGHMPVTWPQYDQEHTHLRLSMNPRIQQGLWERKVKFWMEFYPKLTGTKHENEANDGRAEGQKPKEEL